MNHYLLDKNMPARKPVGEFDLLIGSTAIVHNKMLVTRNTKDFENLESIQLENWIA